MKTRKPKPTLLLALTITLLSGSGAFGYYDPHGGRFLSPDPLGHEESMSLYDYCGGDPINRSDPDGRLGKNWMGHSDSVDVTGVGSFVEKTLFGAAGAILQGIGSTPSVMDQASWGMAQARQEISQYEGGEAFLARALMLQADFAFGTTKLVNDPINTISDMPQGFVNFGGKIGADVYNVGANPSVNTVFNIAEDALGVWGMVQGSVALYRGGANYIQPPPATVKTPWQIAVQEMSSEALTALNQVRNGTTLYKGGFIDFNNPVGAGPSETVGSQFLSLENPLSPGYAARYGIPPRNQNFNFVLTGEIRPGAAVVTRSAPGIPPNPGGGVEAVTTPTGFKLNSFYMP